MRLKLFLLFTIATLAAPVQASDLRGIDRTIAKEPAYPSKSPRYCLLVFGLEAKTRVWLVEDGDTLYVDRNANGDLTEKDEKIVLTDRSDSHGRFPPVEIKADGLTHSNLVVTRMKATKDFVGNDAEWQRVERESPEHWVWWITIDTQRSANDPRPVPQKISYVINGDGKGMLVFGSSPKTAPIIHLNGPWSLGLQDAKQQLCVGRDSTLQIGVGTQGVGPGTFAFVLYPNTIPKDAYPVAEVTFPAKSSNDPPIKKLFTLKERC